MLALPYLHSIMGSPIFCVVYGTLYAFRGEIQLTPKVPAQTGAIRYFLFSASKVLPVRNGQNKAGRERVNTNRFAQ